MDVLIMASSKTPRAVARDAYSLALKRREHFNPALFSDPAWNMMLYLFLAGEEGQKVGDVCGASLVPHSTALRCIKALLSTGVFASTNLADGSWPDRVTLTEDARLKLTAILSDAPAGTA
ncbi:hypothetical protein ACBY01_02085 [Sphingomonas sp. ac-8]|uniref:hypothetical protein n=1 Tax=Sphingomonas sp. ac-8 TaxID=3242977 RepID=UPI003A8019F0